MEKEDYLGDVQSLEQDCVLAFRRADEGGKGYLTSTDYKVAVMELCGYKPSKYEINAVWARLDSSSPPPGERMLGNGEYTSAVFTVTKTVRSESTGREVGMDQSTFVSLMVDRLRQKDKDEQIRQVFIAFDVHMRGFITTSDCVQAFKEVVPLISNELVERWFEEVDSDSDGRVTFRDFEMMMKSFLLINPSHQK